MRFDKKGHLFGTGTGSIKIELPAAPAHFSCNFDDAGETFYVLPSCNPMIADSVSACIVREPQGSSPATTHHAHRHFLVIQWSVNGTRKIHWIARKD